ncbi:hypothetical protein JMJ35_002736 [Cladonia borealis]|uniref:Uncharacterized protein n=1 Tax=Cladonia borealis TaxID=184061 RepID=A0AA39R5P0_9LECA|nr:hypothetical protein JMJ35_002736 [Cladonia borealis]
MYFSKITTFAIVAALPAVFGSPILEARQDGTTCQTSSASPLTGDVTAVINQLKGLGAGILCAQTNGHASDCTTVVSSGTASIAICGGVDDGSSAISCSDVANYADEIQQTCLNGAPNDPNTRTGGTYTISASKRVEVV